jgi:NhaP-type Na+/H+ or K+/H+ antiporter
MVAVLVSGLAHRSILSTAVIFLVTGFVLALPQVGVISMTADNDLVHTLAELALFSVLFTDGMRVGIRDLIKAWHLPGRALLFGMPLTMILTAVAAHWLAGLNWVESFLIGAILSPTDPVFASAIVGRKEVPQRLRHLLNVESGVNDGLALPVVIAMLAVASSQEVAVGDYVIEVIGGIALGIVVPWVCIKLEQSRFFSASTNYEPLNAFAIGLLVLALAKVLHQNEFLAAFAAGITVATIGPEVRNAFHHFGELVAELLKLAALLVFGALITVEWFGEFTWLEFVFIVIALVLVRPIALAVALAGSKLGWAEWFTAGWFGPKGFASVVYGLLVLKSGIDGREHLFHLIALVIAASIIAHSSTDVLVAKWFARLQRGSIDQHSHAKA